MEAEQLEPAVDFLIRTREDEQVAIMHHWDMDGTASATLTSKLLGRTRGRPADIVTMPADRCYHLTEQDHEELQNMDRLILVDFNIDADELEELQDEHGLDVLVVDHHNFGREADIPFVNPRLQDPDSYIPASAIMIQVAAELGLEENLRWIAGLGVIQDFGVEACPKMFEELQRQHPALFPEELTQQKLAKECEYGRYSSVLNIKPYRDGHHFAELAHRALMKSDRLEELEAQEEYRQVYEVYLEMQDEFQRVVEDYEEEREIDRDKMVVWFELDSNFHISSSVATNMSTKTPEWVHIVVQRRDGEADISARCQSGRVDLGELMQNSLPDKAVEEGAEGGGHDKAAGASMPEEHLQEFKQNMYELL